MPIDQWRAFFWLEEEKTSRLKWDSSHVDSQLLFQGYFAGLIIIAIVFLPIRRRTRWKCFLSCKKSLEVLKKWLMFIFYYDFNWRCWSTRKKKTRRCRHQFMLFQVVKRKSLSLTPSSLISIKFEVWWTNERKRPTRQESYAWKINNNNRRKEEREGERTRRNTITVNTTIGNMLMCTHTHTRWRRKLQKKIEIVTSFSLVVLKSNLQIIFTCISTAAKNAFLIFVKFIFV